VTKDVDGLYTKIENAFVVMRDGIELCVNIYLPFAASKNGEKVPVIASLGPYGKDVRALEFGLPKTDIYAKMLRNVKPIGPDSCFELADPLVWVMSTQFLH
jgi:hypothetical protein